VLDTLMPDLVGHDRQPSALIVYLFLWLQTGGRGSAQISLLDLALGLGCPSGPCKTPYDFWPNVVWCRSSGKA